MKIAYLFVAHLMLIALAIATASAADTFAGIITDTMCGAKPHSQMSKGSTDEACAKMCVKGPHEYALLEGANVLKLSDQKAAAKYPAQKVKVTGAYDAKNKNH